MRALHSAERKGTLAPQDGKKLGNSGRRVISLLLCLCMTIPMLLSLGGFATMSEDTMDRINATLKAVNRVADRNTMDDYKNRLLSETVGSRYAGRVWTDKSVFAYDVGGNNEIGLDMATDGYNGNVSFNADFAHVFSALASSQLENEAVTSPLDLVILLDMSGSMGTDIQLDDELEGTIPIKTLNGDRNLRDNTMIITPGNAGWSKAWWDVYAATYSEARKGYVVTEVHRASSQTVTVNVPSKGILVAVHDPEVTAPDHMKVDVGDVLMPSGITFNEKSGVVSKVSSDAAFNIYKGHADMDERISHSRIYKVLESINSAIEQLMEMNETNRVTVVGYGGTAATILPLGHYEKIEGKDYISVGEFTDYGETSYDKDEPDSAAYTVFGHATKVTYDENGKATRVKEETHIRNDYNNDGTSGNTLIGFHTNLQAGIYVGFNNLYKELKNKDDVTYTYRSTMTSEERTVPRIPVAFVMTDGGSNYAVKATSAQKGGIGSEWYNLTVPTSLSGDWNAYDVTDYKKYRAEKSDATGGDAVILDILLTASYMKSKIQNKYTSLLQEAGILDKAKGEKADFQIHSISVDSKNFNTSSGAYQIPRIYAGLDPKDFFKSDTDLKAVEGIETDPANWTYRSSVTSAYNHFNTWKASSTGTTISFVDTETRGGVNTNITVKYNKLPANHEGVTNADVEENILYNDSFVDIGAADLTETFRNLIDRFDVPVFAPISGDNDAGVGDSITYQDPLGEYMEIKNSSITTAPHHVGDPAIGEGDERTYDMALLVFGEMHGLVRAGVYDYQWNNTWMEKYKGKPDPTNPDVLIEPDKTPFPQGWYKGSPEEAAAAPLSGDYLTTDLAGTWPNTDPVTGKKYNNAQEARDDGWVMRFNFSTLLSFVPIASAPEDGLPGGLSDQEKNTVYTCYRFAGTQADRNELHINPIYGSTVPKTILDAWEKYYEEHHSYPIDDSLYAKEPGVYRLSDIRVWLEDTGDYVDSDGAITPNTGYDRSLYLNVPTAAVPTQLATITISDDEVLSYQTNLPDDHKDDPNYNDYCYQSTPLRLFYAVGLEENLILRDTDGNQLGVDFTKISPEYIQAHGVVNEGTGEQQNYVWFISNFYSNTTYGDYVADMTTDARTRGDPTVTFSPNEDNRYYVFQKPLPLYAHAYRMQKDGALKPVDNDTYWRNWPAEGESGAGTWTWAEGHENGAGNGSTTWEDSENDVKGGGSWSGGLFMGVYKNGQSFADARNHLTSDDEGNSYITDDHNTKYLYIESDEDGKGGGIVFLEDDLLDHVTTDHTDPNGGYTSDSISFSSDDYYFILLEYYLPTGGIGTNLQGQPVAGTTNARKVQRVLARKGSEFGSGFVSQKIGNGEMLCWTDLNGHVTDAFEYLSKSETGDPSRGEPTFEKLTNDGAALKKYLTATYGIKETDTVPNPDYDPNVEGSQENINVLDYLVNYWMTIRENEQVKEALDAAKGEDTTLTRDEFNAYFQFAVATRPGGIRIGDMSSNIQTKGEYDEITGKFSANATNTSNSYYLPTISENSGTGENVIINNYLGNNGRLEIANQMLHVTKQLVPPTGFELTNEAKNEKFNYQIFVQGVSGTRSAILTEYNEYGKTWERQLAYIDVLTDNSDLVLDNSSNRALFVMETFTGSAGNTTTAKQVIAEVDADGNTVYYEANEDGTLTFDKDGKVDTTVNKQVAEDATLYYLYLPSNGTGDTALHTRRLYQNSNYDGTSDGYAVGTSFKNNGTTTFYAEGERKDTGTAPDSGNNTSFREATDTRPAGTITYWAQDAELIPMQEVLDAEATNDVLSGEPAAYALMAAPASVWWQHKHDDDTYADNGDCTQEGHVNLTYDTFVIRKPAGETSMTAFESPFKTRTQYMTVDLNFGVNANEDGSGEKGQPLTKENLYDTTIPSTDRPDLFLNVATLNGADIDNTYIASHTAEFTLKHNEGLLLSGPDNRVAYRFTEKLTDEQMKKGYTLKEVSHIQQVGSKSTYKLGVQKIPIYTKDNATYGPKYGAAATYKTENGLTWEQDGAVKNLEPFAHTNAVLWECYATMATGASGNHHQPKDTATKETEKNVTVWDGTNPNTYITIENVNRTVEDNPSCTIYDADKNPTGCDVEIKDAEGALTGYLHYMYRNGELVDPHYEGEASTMLRNMARYVVSPTAHFGLTDEEVSGTNPENGYYEYSGVYSVYGNTGWFEEQVHYINTVSPELLVLTKQIVSMDGTVVENPPEKEFTFTITFTDTTAQAIKKSGGLYYWKGKKDFSGGMTWTDKKTNETYSMPSSAPNLDKYQDYILPADSAGEKDKTYLAPLELEEGKTEYTVKLKANEAVVIYGLTAGTGYTVVETPVERYPAVGGSDHTETGDTYFTQSGTVWHDLSEANSMFPNATPNRVNFYNQLPDGMLTIGKKILDSDADTVTKEFTFEVTLTSLPDDASPVVTKYDKNGVKVDDFAVPEWKSNEDGGKVITFTLRHKETVVIEGIPLGTEYTVKETQRDGYNLQHVADNMNDDPEYLPLTNGGITGTITAEKSQINLLFANGKAVAPPFTGGIGVGGVVFGGILLIGLSVALFLYGTRKKRRVI